MLRRSLPSFLLLVLAVGFSSTATADIYDFTSTEPKGGKLLLVDDEVMIGGPSGPGRAGFGVSTCSSNRGLTCIWFDRERDKTRVLVIDDSKDTPRVTFRQSDSPQMKLGPHEEASENVAWSWQKVKSGDDKSRDARLRVEFGKFKGWYLAAEPVAADNKNAAATQIKNAQTLKLTRSPSEALTFHVYVVSK